MPIFSESKEHTSRSVKPGSSSRENRGENDGIHQRCSPQNSSLFKDKSERRYCDIRLRGAKKRRVSVRNEEADHCNRTNIEEHNAPENSTNCARNGAGRILSFASCRTDQLCALERVPRDEKDENDAFVPSYKRRLTCGPVSGTRRVTENSSDHCDSQNKKYENCCNFDSCKPKLTFPVSLRGKSVNDKQDCQEQC